MLIELGASVRRANAACPRASGGFLAHSNSAEIRIRMENIGEVKKLSSVHNVIIYVL